MTSNSERLSGLPEPYMPEHDGEDLETNEDEILGEIWNGVSNELSNSNTGSEIDSELSE